MSSVIIINIIIYRFYILELHIIHALKYPSVCLNFSSASSVGAENAGYDVLRSAGNLLFLRRLLV
jgi:hypothetical protein